MSFSEIISAWNETMTIKIHEADIKNPSEHFFRRLLVSILKNLNVDTSCYDSFDSESGTKLRALRIKLVHTVNLFYKIAWPGSKQDFCYMDLIQPTPKKVVNILRYLLNYVVFVRHTYESTVAKLKDQLSERDRLQTLKNTMRKENEEAKITEENNSKAIKDLDANIPTKKSKIAELEEKEKTLKANVVKLEEKLERSEMRLMDFKNELASLEDKDVPEQEIESILSAKEYVDKQLDEQDQIVIAVRQKLRENSRAIDEAIDITTKMEALKSAYNLDPTVMKQKKKHLDDLKLEASSLKSSLLNKTIEIDSLTQTLEAKKKTFTQITKKRDNMKMTYDSKHAEEKKILKEKENLVRKLSVQQSNLAATKKELEDEHELLFKIASNVIKQISKKVFDDKENQILH